MPVDANVRIEAAQIEERLILRIAVVWFLIIPLLLFWITQLRPLSPMELSVMPVAPKPGDPVLATARLNNPTEAPSTMQYEFHRNGEALLVGLTRVHDATTKTFQFAQKQPFTVGDRSAFTMKVSDGNASYTDQHAVPEYPPLVLSSFVSFAVSSTTLMSSIVSMSYYQSSFTVGSVIDIGLVLVITLLGLAMLHETALMQPLSTSRVFMMLSRLTQRFQPILVALIIIFGGMAITRLMLLFRVIA